jgi:alcohol dehydrogenase
MVVIFAIYEGVDRSAQPQLPLVAINTTAGTASEMTRFCIITDEQRHVKMAIIDKHVTPIASVNDPMLMMKQPADLTAATGMDALTHAIEAYVSTAATPLTDALALKAVEMIVHNLPQAVKHGDDVSAREVMAYAQFMAGCAFNNASLGYVHAMAHQLGGLLNLPHVQRFNAKAVAPRLRDIASAMGVDTKGMAVEKAAEACIAAIERLSATVGTNRTLRELGVLEEHIAILAENALKDACGLTNPVKATSEEICGIFRAAM